ncbi:uncharacterized protein LOC144883184 [Branchiostoma floridae x Branchiostoma japonicum]
MEKFVGKWLLSELDFDQLKKLYMSKFGAHEAQLNKDKEKWMTIYLEVTEKGTHWKHANAPNGDTTMKFDTTKYTCEVNRPSRNDNIKSTFEMKSDTEIVIHNPNRLTMTAKLTGNDLTFTQAIDDVSVDSVFTKSTE